MNLNLIISVISLLFALISFFIGIDIIRRIAGKLKTAVVFMILVIVIIVIREILTLTSIIPLDIITGIMRITVTLLILLAMLSMKSVINGIDRKYKIRKR